MDNVAKETKVVCLSVLVAVHKLCNIMECVHHLLLTAPHQEVPATIGKFS